MTFEELKYLKDNKSLLIKEKKQATKFCDGVSLFMYKEDDTVVKSLDDDLEEEFDKLHIKLVINTTNLCDSHRDVHMKGIWKKSVTENPIQLLLQEHVMKFQNVISDSAQCYTKLISWKNLGYDYEGKTECLIFDVIINKEDNEYMFDMYRKGKVKQHSVGMQYVKLFLCINSEDKYFAEEKTNWDKYYNEVSNKEVIDEIGYFWAVTEAKVCEGSAVVRGSNFATPTLVTESVKHSEQISDSHENTIDKSEIRNLIKTILKN